MGSSRNIPSKLSKGCIPGPGASLPEIEAFARSFDAPSCHGSFKRIVEIAALRSHETLEDVRTCLCLEERRLRQCRMMGIEPGGQDIEYMKELVGRIRARAPGRRACRRFAKTINSSGG